MMGGGLGTWISERHKLSEDIAATNTLSGMSGAWGGLLASPILTSVLVLELARPKAARFTNTLVATLLSSSVAFAVYFPIAGSTFVGLYTTPSYKYEDWQLLAAIPLGLVAGSRADHRSGDRTGHGAVRSGRQADGPARGARGNRVRVGRGRAAAGRPPYESATTVIGDGLGAGLLIAVVFAKILVFAVCEATGFIGGPFLAMLFIGGTAGVSAHVLIPGLPEGFAFAAMFAALPGALVNAPFSLILLAALTTQIGTLQIAPVAIAVLTAYLAVGTGTLIALANRAHKPAA